MTINAWIAYVVAGAWLLLLGALAVVLVINADLRASIATDDAAKTLLQTQNSEWARKTALTDAALAKLKTAAAAKAKAVVQAESAAAANEKPFRNQATAIAALSFEGSDCEQVTALRNTYMEHLR